MTDTVHKTFDEAHFYKKFSFSVISVLAITILLKIMNSRPMRRFINTKILSIANIGTGLFILGVIGYNLSQEWFYIPDFFASLDALWIIVVTFALLYEIVFIYGLISATMFHILHFPDVRYHYGWYKSSDFEEYPKMTR
jgi:hypothetical protein